MNIYLFHRIRKPNCQLLRAQHAFPHKQNDTNFHTCRIGSWLIHHPVFCKRDISTSEFPEMQAYTEIAEHQNITTLNIVFDTQKAVH